MARDGGNIYQTARKAAGLTQEAAAERLVVVRTGALSFYKDATYRVGCFDVDPTDLSAKKFYFFRSGGGIEDPARWKKYYTDIRYAVIDTPEGGVICG